MEGVAESVAGIIELTTDPLTGNSIQIIDDIGAQISIPEDFCVQEVIIPEVIAAETIVTTTSLLRRVKNGEDRTVRESSGNFGALQGEIRYNVDTERVGVTTLDVLVDSGDDIDSLNPPPGAVSVWPPFDLAKFKTDIAEDFGSGDSFVTLIPDAIPGEEHMIGNHGYNKLVRSPRVSDNVQEASIREMTKRENDRLKKKQLRTNPMYRQKEKEKAQVRMKLRRQDPIYRDIERQRDRQRRKAARQRNQISRVKERERDKEHKRQQRVNSKNVILSMNGLEDTYVVVDSLLMEKSESFDGS